MSILLERCCAALFVNAALLSLLPFFILGPQRGYLEYE
jgi:hypothetical protein